MVHSPVLVSLYTFLLERPAKETPKKWLIQRFRQSLLAKLYPNASCWLWANPMLKQATVMEEV